MKNKRKFDHNNHAGMPHPRMFSHHRRSSEVRKSLITYYERQQMKTKSKKELLVWFDSTWRQNPVRQGCQSFIWGFFVIQVCMKNIPPSF